jgi:excinuclease UvrABC ATPase subunit
VQKRLITAGLSKKQIKNIDVGIPLETFICFTGVSVFSKKKQHINETLYPELP